MSSQKNKMDYSWHNLEKKKSGCNPAYPDLENKGHYGLSEAIFDLEKLNLSRIQLCTWRQIKIFTASITCRMPPMIPVYLVIYVTYIKKASDLPWQ